MSNVLVNKDKLDVLANAISNKSGEPLTLTLDEMVEAVDGIEVGGGITPTGNINITQAGVTDVTNYATATVPEGEIEVSGFFERYTTVSGSRKFNVTVGAGVVTGDDYGTPGYIADETWVSRDRVFNAIAMNTSVTPTESSQTIGGADVMMEGAVTVEAISSDYVGSAIDRYDSSDLTVSGATVSGSGGYYANAFSASVASGTEGTPTATKGAVSNHSVSVTPSVTNSAGYISGGTHNGTAVTVSASELVSGSQSITDNGDYDVTNLASVSVNVSGGGSSDVVTGTLNVASNVNTSTSTQITTTSAIGFTPTKFFFWKDSRTATSNHVHQATFTTIGSYYIRTMTRYSSNALSTSGNTNNWTTQTAGYLYYNSNTIYFRSSSSYILSSGTWHWVAVK